MRRPPLSFLFRRFSTNPPDARRVCRGPGDLARSPRGSPLLLLPRLTTLFMSRFMEPLLSTFFPLPFVLAVEDEEDVWDDSESCELERLSELPPVLSLFSDRTDRLLEATDSSLSAPRLLLELLRECMLGTGELRPDPDFLPSHLPLGRLPLTRLLFLPAAASRASCSANALLANLAP